MVGANDGFTCGCSRSKLMSLKINISRIERPSYKTVSQHAALLQDYLKADVQSVITCHSCLPRVWPCYVEAFH